MAHVNDEEEGRAVGRPESSEAPAANAAKGKSSAKMAVAAVSVLALTGAAVGLGVALTRPSSEEGSGARPEFALSAGPGNGTLVNGVPVNETLPTAALDEMVGVYLSSDSDYLPYQLSGFGTHVLRPYLSQKSDGNNDTFTGDGCSELREDLVQAATYLANVVIKRNEGYGRQKFNEWEMQEDFAVAAPAVTSVAEVTFAAQPPPAEATKGQVPPAPAPSPPSAGSDEMSAEAEFGETDYGTNSQTEGVDEGDLVKSDGTYVYAAYGDRLVVFSKDGGGKLSETFMPKSPPPEGCGGGYQYDDDPFPMPMPMPMPEPDVGGNRRRRRNLQRRDHDRRRTSIVPPYWDPCHIADPRIESILLDDESGRVSVILSGNQRPSHYYWGYGPSREDDDEQTILGDSAGTQVRVYDTASLISSPDKDYPALKLVGSRSLPGRFTQKGSRSIGSKAYIVTQNEVDTWFHFKRHFDRFEEAYDDLDDSDYVKKATRRALNKIIPGFVDRMMEELLEGDTGGTCAHVARVAMFQTGDIDDKAMHWWDDGIFQGVAQVTSVDLDLPPMPTEGEGDADADAEPTLAVDKSIAFTPSAWGATVYASQNKLFLAVEGYDQHPRSRSGYVESTFLYGFSLNGGEGAAKATMVGKALGTALNQFSMDEHDGALRIATTAWADWLCEAMPPPPPKPVPLVPVAEIEPNVILPVPKMDEEVVEDAEIIEPWSGCGQWSPTNQITILSTSSGEVMEEVGHLGGLGKPGESIYAVRFVKEKGFVVTFERTDPFYTLDLSDPENPEIVGELEISGFSNYLHPTEDPDTFLAVGEDADKDGRVIGVQIQIFDVKDFANPELIARYNLENSKNTWSSSAVQMDHRAFRYLPRTRTVIMPAQMSGGRRGESFDGFYAFGIDKDNEDKEERIVLKHRINMAPSEEEIYSRCYSSATLSPRSMVFDGNALLMKNHAAESHDLDAPQDRSFLWRLDMDDPATKTELESKGLLCNYWFL